MRFNFVFRKIHFPSLLLYYHCLKVQTTFHSFSCFFLFKLENLHVSFSPFRLHAHRGHGGGPEAPGLSARGPAGLREQPAPRGPPEGGQAAHDPASAATDGHQGRAALLQYQGAGKGAHAQTLPGDAGGQGLIGGQLIGQAELRAASAKRKETWTKTEGTQEKETPHGLR